MSQVYSELSWIEKDFSIWASGHFIHGCGTPLQTSNRTTEDTHKYIHDVVDFTLLRDGGWGCWFLLCPWMQTRVSELCNDDG